MPRNKSEKEAQWHHVAVTYDSSKTTKPPDFYLTTERGVEHWRQGDDGKFVLVQILKDGHAKKSK